MPATAVSNAIGARKVKTAKVASLRTRPDDEVQAPVVDLVRVKATSQGFYAYQKLMTERFSGSDEERYYVGRDNLLRNEGEVFLHDAFDMKVPIEDPSNPGRLIFANQTDMEGRPLVREVPMDAEIIETENAGVRVLPWWVTLVEENEKLTSPKGHKKFFGKRDGVDL